DFWIDHGDHAAAAGRAAAAGAAAWSAATRKASAGTSAAAAAEGDDLVEPRGEVLRREQLRVFPLRLLVFVARGRIVLRRRVVLRAGLQALVFVLTAFNLGEQIGRRLL